MSAVLNLLLAAVAFTTATPVPVPQTNVPIGDCDPPTAPDLFQLAAVPVFAQGSLIALTSTGGGSGLVVIPTADDTFDGAANFTYDASSQRWSTTGETSAPDAPVYTSLAFQDSLSLSFSTEPDDDPSGLLEIVQDGACSGTSYFVKQGEESAGLYGWTLCNDGALGWTGTSTDQPCEKVAMRAYVNDTDGGDVTLMSASAVLGKARLRY